MRWPMSARMSDKPGGHRGRERDRRRADDGAALQLRARRRRPATGVMFTVHLAPMIDVTFLLLIFFLVTTTFERAEGILASKLPEARGAPAVALPVSPIIVRLTQTGPGYDDYAIRVDRFQDVPVDSKELRHRLVQIQELPGFDRQTPVVIVAENEVRWDHVVSCWNAAVGAACERIAFAEP